VAGGESAGPGVRHLRGSVDQPERGCEAFVCVVGFSHLPRWILTPCLFLFAFADFLHLFVFFFSAIGSICVDFFYFGIEFLPACV